MASACSTSASFCLPLIAQPTTRPEKRSSTTARYIQPFPVAIYVTSATHFSRLSLGLEGAVKDVFRWISMRCHHMMSRMMGRKLGLLHQPYHPLAPNRNAFIAQLLMNAWTAITPLMLLIDFHDLFGDFAI